MINLPTTDIEIAIMSEDNVVFRLYDATPFEVHRPIQAAYVTGDLLDAKVVITLSDETAYEVTADENSDFPNVEVRLGEVTGAPITTVGEYYSEQEQAEDEGPDAQEFVDVSLEVTLPGGGVIVQRRHYGLSPNSDEAADFVGQAILVGKVAFHTGRKATLTVTCPVVAALFADEIGGLDVQVGEVTGPAVTTHTDWIAVNGERV